MAKYVFTYFLNTACRERRPQTKEDLENDWIIEEKNYPTDLEAFEHAYLEILDNTKEDLIDLYEENRLGPNNEVKKLEALKNDFDYIDIGDGSIILISIEGPEQTYNSGYTKEDFIDDWEDLEESKKLTKNKNKSNKLKKIAKEQIDFDLNEAGYYYWELINNGIDRDEFIRAMMNEDEGGMMNQYNLSYEDACKVYGLIWDNMPGMLDESEKYKKLKESKELPIAKVFATEKELDQYKKDNHIQTSECHTFKNGIVLIYEPDKSENKKLKEDDWDYLEENKKLIEDYDNEIKVYMNTWKNYNEYGADLVLYDNIDGWMSIEEAKEFAELHNDDEPFINDTENCPIKVSEYDNCMKILEDLEAYEDCDDKEVLTAILESENDDIQNALEILNSGDYIFFADIDNDEDLAHAYIDMIGGLDGINNIEDYIDENAYKESWREIAENTIREEQPDLDENSDEFENEVELWLDTVYPEQLALAIENNSKDLEDYFDYEAYGRDLSFKYFYASTGAISII